MWMFLRTWWVTLYIHTHLLHPPAALPHHHYLRGCHARTAARSGWLLLMTAVTWRPDVKHTLLTERPHHTLQLPPTAHLATHTHTHTRTLPHTRPPRLAAAILLLLNSPLSRDRLPTSPPVWTHGRLQATGRPEVTRGALARWGREGRGDAAQRVAKADGAAYTRYRGRGYARYYDTHTQLPVRGYQCARTAFPPTCDFYPTPTATARLLTSSVVMI